MIEKFNFYDVYGYLLPGFALLALLWLPYGILTGRSPQATIASSALAIGGAYILGHLLQRVALQSLPPWIKDSEGKNRFPSDVVLDEEDHNFTKEFKGRLAKSVSDVFGLDVRVKSPRHGLTEKEITDIRSVRKDAFYLARSALIKDKCASYAEQFQGMYSLMLGLTAAFVLGSSFIAGCALSSLDCHCLAALAGVAVTVGILAAGTTTLIIQVVRPNYTKTSLLDKLTFIGLILTTLGAGYLFGRGSMTWCPSALTVWVRPSPGQSILFGIISAVELLATFRCFGAYKGFAKDFAEAVWRDFACHEWLPSGPTSSPAGPK